MTKRPYLVVAIMGVHDADNLVHYTFYRSDFAHATYHLGCAIVQRDLLA